MWAINSAMNSNYPDSKYHICFYVTLCSSSLFFQLAGFPKGIFNFLQYIRYCSYYRYETYHHNNNIISSNYLKNTKIMSGKDFFFLSPIIIFYDLVVTVTLITPSSMWRSK